MRSRRPLVVPALALLLVAGGVDRAADLLALQKDALALLDRIAAAPAGESRSLRREASDKLEALAAEKSLLPAELARRGRPRLLPPRPTAARRRSSSRWE